MHNPSKAKSHGRIGEAASYAKCWMYGIPAYFTSGLGANFTGSDLFVETEERGKYLWIQVKTGYPTLKDHVYVTQCSGEAELKAEKFVSDFVVFVNLDPVTAKSHTHDGTLDFKHMTFYVVPVGDANRIYRGALNDWAKKPKRDGGERKLGNMSVYAALPEMEAYKNAWPRLKDACKVRHSRDG
jgi:hypothetical protein